MGESVNPFDGAPPKTVLFTGSDGPRLERFLEDVKTVQSTTSPADWPTGTPGAALEKDGETWRLRPPADRSLLGRINDLLFEDFTDVSVSRPPFSDDWETAERICVVLPPHPPHQTGQDPKETVDHICQKIDQLSSGNLMGLVVVMEDALSMLETSPPPIDAIHAWKRVCSGTPVGRPPIELAKSRDNWRSPFQQMDKDWANRLTALAELATTSGLEFATLPISMNGFHTTTNLVNTGDFAGKKSVPFNVRVLMQVLNMPSLASVGNLLASGPR